MGNNFEAAEPFSADLSKEFVPKISRQRLILDFSKACIHEER